VSDSELLASATSSTAGEPQRTTCACTMIALVAGLSHSLLVGGLPARTGGARCASSPCMAESPRKLRVGLVGGGTVGGGIVNILEGARELQASLGVDVEIATICVRDKAKPRDFPLPAGCAVVDDVEEILGDGSIDLVCEVMGGTTLAKEVVMRSIADGKHVVTANKALIAAALPELQQKLAEANAKQVLGSEGKFGFEAAVCGGIPIIHALQRDFLGDEVSQLSGIINGCTNFILSNMAQGGLSYSDALKEASALGYAEAAPRRRRLSTRHPPRHTPPPRLASSCRFLAPPPRHTSPLHAASRRSLATLRHAHHASPRPLASGPGAGGPDARRRRLRRALEAQDPHQARLRDRRRRGRDPVPRHHRGDRHRL